MTRGLLLRLLAARAAGRPVALVTDLCCGRQWLVHGDPDEEPPAAEGQGLAAAVLAGARRYLRLDRSGLIGPGEDAAEEAYHFVRSFNPPPRLVVVGAGEMARAMRRLAAELGYRVVAVEAAGPPGSDGPWRDLAVDAHTAVVALTHDPSLEEPALLAALRSRAFYVGALGDRHANRRRLDRLRRTGLGEAELNRIRSPAGLDIGACSQAEAALSILSEITAVRRNRGEAGSPR